MCKCETDAFALMEKSIYLEADYSTSSDISIQPCGECLMMLHQQFAWNLINW